MKPEKSFDVIILGAGPAGTTCALALREAGLTVAMLDKARFPRDKVCGDAIPGRAVKVLKTVHPESEKELAAFPAKLMTKRTAIFLNEKEVEIQWKGLAYTSTRLAFDDLLLRLVQQHTDTVICQETKITSIQYGEDRVELIGEGQQRFNAKLVIAADGAHSIVAKTLAKKKVNKQYYGGAVRAFYKNVSGGFPDRTEIFIQKHKIPGYFWIFPLPDNVVNIGFGMTSEYISRDRVNLKQELLDFISSTPNLRKRFANSEALSSPEGFGLPFGHGPESISGNRFLLTGDAANLVDPMSGDGIGNAMMSGRHAALQVMRSFAQQDFSAKFLQDYERSLYGAIGKELRMRSRLQQVLTKNPVLIDIGFGILGSKVLRSFLPKEWL